MNNLNYCSLEMAQKLINYGIVLETDMSWYFRNNEWILRQSGSVYEGNISIPAPCFAELWRELPVIYKTESGIECRLQLDKIRRTDEVIVSSAQYVYGDEDQYVIIFFAKQNPADALAELLIWVKGQEGV